MKKATFIIGQVKALKNLGLILSIEAVALMTIPTAHADFYRAVGIGTTELGVGGDVFNTNRWAGDWFQTTYGADLNGYVLKHSFPLGAARATFEAQHYTP